MQFILFLKKVAKIIYIKGVKLGYPEGYAAAWKVAFVKGAKEGFQDGRKKCLDDGKPYYKPDYGYGSGYKGKGPASGDGNDNANRPGFHN